MILITRTTIMSITRRVKRVRAFRHYPTRHMRRTMGAEYAVYCKEVRRWL